MNKPLTLLLTLTFLFLFSGVVYGEEPEVKKEFYDNGRLKSEVPYKKGGKEGQVGSWSDPKEKKSHTGFSYLFYYSYF